jgi:hypothetical protein
MISPNFHITSGLAKAAPLVGGVVIISSIIDSSQQISPWTDVWRVAISVSLGVFITLVGMIYHNMESRTANLEKNCLGRTEYDMRNLDLERHLDRIEKHLEVNDRKIENLRDQ